MRRLEQHEGACHSLVQLRWSCHFDRSGAQVLWFIEGSLFLRELFCSKCVALLFILNSCGWKSGWPGIWSAHCSWRAKLYPCKNVSRRKSHICIVPASGQRLLCAVSSFLVVRFTFRFCVLCWRVLNYGSFCTVIDAGMWFFKLWLCIVCARVIWFLWQWHMHSGTSSCIARTTRSSLSSIAGRIRLWSLRISRESRLQSALSPAVTWDCSHSKHACILVAISCLLLFCSVIFCGGDIVCLLPSVFWVFICKSCGISHRLPRNLGQVERVCQAFRRKLSLPMDPWRLKLCFFIRPSNTVP